MPANSTGVYQKDNGYWEYRFVMMVDGKKVNKKKATEAFAVLCFMVIPPLKW